MSEEKLSKSEKQKEDWMNSKWRPMMGWMYMATCTADFIVFPVLWSLLQAIMHTTQMTQWQPLTLQGAGLFHIAMGAVLGIAAMGRTQEKLAGANNGGKTDPAPAGFGVPSFGGSNATTNTPPTGAPAFGAPSTGGFGGASSFASPVAPAASGFGAADATAGFGQPIATTASGKKIVPDFEQPPI